MGRRRLGLTTAMVTALALVLRGDESLMRDEGLMREMRELDKMMKKKRKASEVLQEHGRSWNERMNKRIKRMRYVCIILIRELNKKSFFFLDACYSAHL